MIPFEHIMSLSGALILLGLSGLLMKQGLVRIVMSLQVLLAGVNLAWLGFARERAEVEGQVFALFLLLIAGIQLVVGAALLLGAYHKQKSVHLDQASSLKW